MREKESKQQNMQTGRQAVSNVAKPPHSLQAWE